MTASPRSVLDATDERTRRKGRIYAFTTLCVTDQGLVKDGTTECGYVGKTRQTLTAREQQHRGGAPDGDDEEELDCQPWWDITVGGIDLVEEGDWTDAELAERERFHMADRLPRYNFIDNTDNPNRIPKPVAREHRDNRDRAKGLTPRQWPPFGSDGGRVRPLPGPPQQRRPEPRPAPRPHRSTRPKRALTRAEERRRNRAIGCTILWAVAWPTFWWLLNRSADLDVFADARTSAALGWLPHAALLAVAGRNKRWRNVGKGAAVVVLVLAGWLAQP